MNKDTILLKVSLRILPWLSFLYLLSYLDRANLGNVHITMLKRTVNVTNTTSVEVGVFTEQEYGWAVAIFYVPYILFEVPSNLLLKKTSAPTWLARIMVLWGIVSLSMMFVTDAAGVMMCRFFLGLAEAGFFPGVIYYLSTWFSPKDRAMRVAIFFLANPLSGFVGGLLAYVILSYMDGLLSLNGWQWIFLIEGVPSILFGIMTWWVLPTSPKICDFLTQPEKDWMSKYLSTDSNPANNETDPTSISTDQIKSALRNPKLWLLCCLSAFSTVQGHFLHFFLPAIIGEFGYSAVISNLLSAPLYFLSCIISVSVAFNSDRTQERILHLIFPLIIQISGWSLLSLTYYEPELFTAEFLPVVQYSILMIIVGFSSFFAPVFFALITEDLHGKTTHAVATAMATGFANLGGILSPIIATTTIGKNGSYQTTVLVMIACGLVSLSLLILMKCSNFSSKEEFFAEQEERNFIESQTSSVTEPEEQSTEETELHKLD